jgi:hypothetical protein
MRTYERDGSTQEWVPKVWPISHGWYALDDTAMLGVFGNWLECVPSPDARRAILRTWIGRVGHVAEFVAAGGWDIVASSLLFAYDADPHSAKAPIAYMIDFAHAVQLPGIVDGGYAFGCRELIRMFNHLLLI